MQKQAEIEERILGLLMGIGIGTVIGFLLRVSERRNDPRPARRAAPPASGA